MRTAEDFYTFGNGQIKMSLDNRTNGLVAAALYSAYQRRVRVRIWLGDIETGHAWLEENDIVGYVCVSSGPRHVPILVYNARSFGGGAILDHCIVKIQETKSKRVLYEHPSFGRGHFFSGPSHGAGIAPPVTGLPAEYTTSVWHYHTGDENGWKNVANFHNKDQAKRYVDFMTGKRMSK